jgi:hypothetical protein
LTTTQIKTEILPWVSSESRVMKRVEAVVVGDHDVGVVVQQEGQHVVTLLRDGVVQRSVTLRVLQIKNTFLNTSSDTKKMSHLCFLLLIAFQIWKKALSIIKQ